MSGFNDKYNFDPNGFQYSLFTVQIKLFVMNFSCHRFTLKAWFTMGVLPAPLKHNLGAVTRIVIALVHESLTLHFLYG